MAISINEFNNNVNKFLGVLPGEVQKINTSLALSAIAFVKNNLVNQGVTGEGKSLGKYSDRPLSPGLFIGKGLGSGSDKKVKDYLKQQRKSNPKESPTISYEKFRELNNLPTDHITLSFTGDTLNDLAVIKSSFDNGIVNAQIGSKNSKRKIIRDKNGKETGTISTGQVLENLQNKYGKALDTELLSLSKSQEAVLQKSFEDAFQNTINKILL